MQLSRCWGSLSDARTSNAGDSLTATEERFVTVVVENEHASPVDQKPAGMLCA